MPGEIDLYLYYRCDECGATMRLAFLGGARRPDRSPTQQLDCRACGDIKGMMFVRETAIETGGLDPDDPDEGLEIRECFLTAARPRRSLKTWWEMHKLKSTP